MSLTSTTFIFLFLPIALGIYYILPKSKNMMLKNIFLLLISIFFYAWGELLRVIIIIVLTIITWLLGIMADGKRNTKTGKWAVAICVIINVSILFFYKYISAIFKIFSLNIATELPSLNLNIPLGLSFFCFSSISYVIDIYRGKHSGRKNFLNAALYLSIFFKITMGPIAQYNQFDEQLKSRTTTFDQFSEGVYRLICGLGKKVILAGYLSCITNMAFDSNIELSVTLAWLGAFSYMLELYFDFSGYSDMAIGIANMFGFKLPENFVYPYAATSVTDYWNRWHKTLGEWFRDYLYYPITLGPAIKIRKKLSKKHSKAYCKLVINILTLGAVWLATSVWHGKSVNYLVWGFINGFISLLELYKKPLKNKKLDKFLGWTYTFFVALMVKVLTYFTSLKSAFHYYGAMFGLNHNPFNNGFFNLLVSQYWIYLLLGTILCFPVIKILKNKIQQSNNKTLKISMEIVSGVCLIGILLVSISIMQQSSITVFMYQQF